MLGPVWKASTSLCKLSYVPVVSPNIAMRRIRPFFTSINKPGLLDDPNAQTISITGGKIKANPDEHRAPINEMNAFNAGTTSAKESKNM